MKLPFITDPKDDKPSVSLTLLVVSFVSLLVATGLEISGKTKTTSIIMETFLTCSGLYFTRRMSWKSKTLEVNSKSKEKEE